MDQTIRSLSEALRLMLARLLFLSQTPLSKAKTRTRALSLTLSIYRAFTSSIRSVRAGTKEKEKGRGISPTPRRAHSSLSPRGRRARAPTQPAAARDKGGASEQRRWRHIAPAHKVVARIHACQSIVHTAMAPLRREKVFADSRRAG